MAIMLSQTQNPSLRNLRKLQAVILSAALYMLYYQLRCTANPEVFVKLCLGCKIVTSIFKKPFFTMIQMNLNDPATTV